MEIDHHIERLMILGNFMLLCELSPDAVYRWFMELFIDSYDWVMVFNFCGMSRFADGGLMTTKPYISGSSYVLGPCHPFDRRRKTQRREGGSEPIAAGERHPLGRKDKE